MESIEITNCLTTDYIYLPYDNSMKILKKDREYVYKDEVILSNEKKKIFSTVSGNILGLTTLNHKKYIVIENDFKDKTKIKKGTKRFINKYTKEELVKLINDYQVLDDFDESSKVLIINGIDEYIDEITYNTLLQTNTIEILDTIDALIEIMNIKKCFLAVSNSNIECINILINNIGTYPKIDLKLFTHNHTIGKKEIIIDRLTNYRNKKYNIQYLNIIDVLNIYNVLKKQRPKTTTYITLTGNLINFTKVLKVNIGTNICDILKEYKINNKDNIIINGLLNGQHIKDPNFIIDDKVKSIFINTIEKYKEKKCINCGICTNVCPVNINPKYMYFNKDKKSEDYKKKCINCGLCSYNCPSKINLNKGVYNND